MNLEHCVKAYWHSITNSQEAAESKKLVEFAGEDDVVRKILIHAHLAVDNAKWTDPHTKANALLQAHFGRSNMSADLQADQAAVLPLATRLLQVRANKILSGEGL